MKQKTQLLLWTFFIFTGLVVGIPAAGAEAGSAQGKAYGITVEGTAYTVVTNLGQVTITPAGGGPAVTLAAGQISVSSQNGGAPVAAAAVMNDPALANVVSKAAAMAVSALAVAAAGPSGADSGAANAAIELNHTLDVLMQSLPDRAAFVLESASRTVPAHSGLLVTAGIRAAIAAGMPAEVAGGTMSSAAARGACEASPARAKELALEIANSAILAAVNSGLASRLAATIVSAVTEGTGSGAIQGIMAGAASVAGTAAFSPKMREEAVQVLRFVVIGAVTAVMTRYTDRAESSVLGQSAAAGARSAASAANSRLAFDLGRLEKALSQAQSLAFQKVGTIDRAPQVTPLNPGGVIPSPVPSPIILINITTPRTPVDPGNNVSPSR